MEPVPVDCRQKRPRLIRIKSKHQQDIFYRNIWCACYENCLTEAAINDVYLDCSSCPLHQTKRQYFLLSHEEISGCCSLLGAIFHSSNRFY